MRKSKVLGKLRANQPVLVGTATPYMLPKVVELMGIIGYDCVWIDHEHQDISDDQIWNMCLAARSTDMDAMVRIRKGEYHTFFRAIEGGANGIMVPHVKTREEAENIVFNAKFPPVGGRGIDGVEVHADHGLQPLSEYLEEANRETFVAVQIEDALGVENVEDIASVPGLDVLFVGPSDLAASLGVVGDTSHPRVVEATKRVASAALAAGIHWGAPVSNGERLLYLRDLGATFFSWGAAIVGLHQHFGGIRKEFAELTSVASDVKKPDGALIPAK